MKAILAESYGGPEVLLVDDIPVPRTKAKGVLVQVCATSVNPIDWKLRGGLLQPIRDYRFPVIWGSDLSGRVVDIGSAVTMFKPGDEVFGFKDGNIDDTYRGTYAEYVVVPENWLAEKPIRMSHEDAAAMPLAALTAWQSLITQGRIKSGSRVLIHAGAGGVGVYAIQIAKAFGAFVAATASGRNQQFLKQLGADVAIDYETEQVEDRATGFDLVLDGVGSSVWRDSLRVLKGGGKLITLVAPLPSGKTGKLRFLSTVALRLLWWKFRAICRGRRVMMTRVRPMGGDLEKIAVLAEAGKIHSVIEKILPLEQVAEAHRLSEAGHVRGKIVLRVGQPAMAERSER